MKRIGSVIAGLAVMALTAVHPSHKRGGLETASIVTEVQVRMVQKAEDRFEKTQIGTYRG